MKYLIVFIFLLLHSCKEEKKAKCISLICLRSFDTCMRGTDTVYVRIANNSKDTIFVPSSYEGAFYVDGDSLFLEAVPKPEYYKSIFYKYSKVFPFEVYTARIIPGQVPDTVIKINYQAYFFNQFRMRPFVPLYPGSIHIQTVVFNVPQRADIVRVVYYKKSFANWLGKDSLNYQLDDFIRFDSAEAKYLTDTIFNRYYGS